MSTLNMYHYCRLDELEWALSPPPSVHEQLSLAAYLAEPQCYVVCEYRQEFNKYLSKDYLEALDRMTPKDFVDHIFKELTNEERQSLMYHQTWREKTFRAGWPLEDTEGVNIDGMTRSGVYYSGVDSFVQCVSCSAIIHLWQSSRDEYIMPRKHYPTCVWIRDHIDRRNVFPNLEPWTPSEEDTIPIKLYPQTKFADASPFCAKHFDITVGNLQWYKSESNRKVTFSPNAPHHRFQNSGPSPTDLSNAGFYFTGIYDAARDSVQCFNCQITLSDWKKYDTPWVEHARWSPECSFLLETKGKDFVEEVHVHTPRNKKLTLKPFIPGSYQKAGNTPIRDIKFLFDEFEMNRQASTSTASSPKWDMKFLFGEEPHPMLTFDEDQDSADALGCKNCELLYAKFIEAGNVGLPCGHLLYCSPCADLAKARANKYPGDVKCPLTACQTVLAGTLRVYLV